MKPDICDFNRRNFLSALSGVAGMLTLDRCALGAAPAPSHYARLFSFSTNQLIRCMGTFIGFANSLSGNCDKPMQPF
jgi:hypothetical protein